MLATRFSIKKIRLANNLAEAVAKADTNKFNMNKHLHRILIILIFISVSAAAYLFSTPKNNTTPLLINTSTTPQVKIEELKPATLEENKAKKTEDSVPTTPTTLSVVTGTLSVPPTSTTPTETIPVKFKITDKEYEINIKPGASAYEAMDTLRKSNQISFSTKVFSGLGQFVEEVDGIKNSPSTGFYWTFYINNQEAKVGISNYTIKPNDLITWKYENK